RSALVGRERTEQVLLERGVGRVRPDLRDDLVASGADADQAQRTRRAMAPENEQGSPGSSDRSFDLKAIVRRAHAARGIGQAHVQGTRARLGAAAPFLDRDVAAVKGRSPGALLSGVRSALKIELCPVRGRVLAVQGDRQ